jgi:hypothetical protein
MYRSYDTPKRATYVEREWTGSVRILMSCDIDYSELYDYYRSNREAICRKRKQER